MKNNKSSIIYSILIGLLIAVVVIVGAFAFIKWQEKQETIKKEEQQQVVSSENLTGKVEKWQEGVIRYNGIDYIYNTAIKTYLFMGIDKEGVVTDGEDGFDGGQADAIFLMVVNPKTEEISVISINRNTMAEIEVYTRDGEFKWMVEKQICLQHSYGEEPRLNCIRMVNAVSRLFDDIPIDAYLSMNMEGVPYLNDAVGGVTVEVLEDVDGMGVSLKKGETVTLTGQEAYAYTRWRDTDEFDSATRRLERQNQYIFALMSKLEDTAMHSKSSLAAIYEEVEDYVVTNIDFLSLAEDVTDYEFDESQMYTIPGETIMGARYEEHYIDENALYDMIIEIFYEEVTE